MRFADMMNTHGLSAREVQSDFADAIAKAFSLNGQISLLQADTGVGKSLGYCVPAIIQLAQCGAKRARVIISSNTIALLRQLEQKDLPLAIDIVARNTGYRPKSALLLGRQNFISRSRLETALDELSLGQRHLYAESINALLEWTDAIDLFINEYGDLPAGLTPERICQTSYTLDDDYQVMKQDALSADVLICSHAMLVNDILLRGNLLFSGSNAERPTYLIVDEADLLHGMLVERQQMRLNIKDMIREVSPFAKGALLSTLDEVADVATRMADGRSFNSSSDIQTVLREQLRHITNGLRGYSEEQAQALRAHIDMLLGQSLCRIGAGVSPVRNEPAAVFINPFMTRIFEQYAVNHYQSTVLTSGTLSTFDDPVKGTQWIRRDLGITQAHTGLIEQFSPKHFGEMAITLAGPDFPHPFQRRDEVLLNPYWIEALAQHLLTLKGPMLVLTGSHMESEMLHQQLGAGTVHLRGERLSAAISRYWQNGDHVLITAAGKTGLDLRNLDGSQHLKHVVLTRIPFQRRDEHYEHELASYIQSTHPSVSNPAAFVRNMRYMLNLNSAIRITKQALGRGIRDAGDSVSVHIMDPRFPSFDSLNSVHNALRSAIPKRFLPEYQSATLLRGSAALEEIEIW